MIASLVRVAVLCAFLAALAVHIHRRSPGEPRVIALPLASHAHDQLRYLLLPAEPAEPAAGGGRAGAAHGGALGSLEWRCRDQGADGCDELWELRIADLMRIPSVAMAARMLPAAPPAGLEVELRVTCAHAPGGRLAAAEAELSAGGTALAHGSIAFGAHATGLAWRWASGAGSREYPALPPLAGLAVAAILPAHLRPGMRMAVALPAVDAASWAPAMRRDVLVVREPEEIGTIAGVQSLMRVDELGGSRRVASLWCDDDGVVWRASWDDLGLCCELSGRGGAGR